MAAHIPIFTICLSFFCFPDQAMAILLGIRHIGNFDGTTLINIDHLRITHLPFSASIQSPQMHMTVEEVFGFVFLQKGQKGLKTLMGRISMIPYTCGRRMGDHNVHTFTAPQRETQSLDAAAHLWLCVLMGTGMIPAATAQPQNPDTPIDHQPVINTVAALRRMMLVAAVVIAMDIEYRTAAFSVACPSWGVVVKISCAPS